MKRTLILGVFCLVFVTACSSTPSTRVAEIKPTDKQLSCTDIALEVNEAQFMAKMAERNRGLNLRNVTRPLGYVGTFSSAQNAIEAASTRVEYLQQVSSVKNCAGEAANQVAQAAQQQALAQQHAALQQQVQQQIAQQQMIQQQVAQQQMAQLAAPVAPVLTNPAMVALPMQQQMGMQPIAQQQVMPQPIAQQPVNYYVASTITTPAPQPVMTYQPLAYTATVPALPQPAYIPH